MHNRFAVCNIDLINWHMIAPSALCIHHHQPFSQGKETLIPQHSRSVLYPVSIFCICVLIFGWECSSQSCLPQCFWGSHIQRVLTQSNKVAGPHLLLMNREVVSRLMNCGSSSNVQSLDLETIDDHRLRIEWRERCCFMVFLECSERPAVRVTSSQYFTIVVSHPIQS